VATLADEEIGAVERLCVVKKKTDSETKQCAAALLAAGRLCILLATKRKYPRLEIGGKASWMLHEDNALADVKAIWSVQPRLQRQRVRAADAWCKPQR
jgi:hypothetical protein